MKKLLAIILLFINALAFPQARMVLNGNPYIVMNNGTAASPAYIVIDNSSPNAITLSTAQINGGIKSESEFNMVKWNISNNTGTYSVPFTKSSSGPAIPFAVTVTSGGNPGGNVKFSTYPGATWDNNTYKPTDVTNMISNVGGANNSAKVIDRFWITDATSYSTKPTATFSFTYVDAEWGAAGNSISEGSMGAQRFNTSASNWDAYLPQGVCATGVNTVTSVPVAPADFFRSWTLVDNSSPLPIELISFNGQCKNNQVILSWITASETNNDFFTVEKSYDAINYYSVGIVNGGGNINSVSNYSFSDNSNNSSGAYYRISQTDFNGASEIFPSIFISSCGDTESLLEIYSDGSNEFTLVSGQQIAGNYVLTLFNSLGQVIKYENIFLPEGLSKNTFKIEDVSDAMYFVNITNGKDKNYTKKIIINQ